MILNLGGSISVDSKDIVAILDLSRTRSPFAGAMLREARRQNRILAGQGIKARSAILCAGAKQPGGVQEHERLYLSPIASGKLARRAGAHRARLMEAAAEWKKPEKETMD